MLLGRVYTLRRVEVALFRTVEGEEERVVTPVRPPVERVPTTRLEEEVPLCPLLLYELPERKAEREVP